MNNLKLQINTLYQHCIGKDDDIPLVEDDNLSGQLYLIEKYLHGVEMALEDFHKFNKLLRDKGLVSDEDYSATIDEFYAWKD